MEWCCLLAGLTVHFPVIGRIEFAWYITGSNVLWIGTYCTTGPSFRLLLFDCQFYCKFRTVIQEWKSRNIVTSRNLTFAEWHFLKWNVIYRISQTSTAPNTAQLSSLTYYER